MKERITRLSLGSLLSIVIPPPLLICFFWLTSANEVSTLQIALALSLLYIAWVSYLRWKKNGEEVFPIFAMMVLMYWIYYGLPLFWTDRMVADAYSPGKEVPDEAITLALLMALVGVSVLWAGMKAGRYIKVRVGQGVTFKQSRMNYVGLVLVVCCALSFSESLSTAFGVGGRQLVATLLTVVPTLAFVVLLRRYVRGEGRPIDNLLTVLFLGTRLVIGLASGWLGAFASIILICTAVYLAELKKLPRILAFTAVAFVLFFQVGKDDFRRVYWQKEAEPTGKLERVTFWTEKSLDRWGAVVAGQPNGETIREALNPSISRVSLLTQAANVIDETPSVVPYQYGRLYSYMLITFIPRFIWPDKPSMNEANQFYQVAYGLSSEDELATVSIAVGVLAESYISFGWFGVIGIMFIMGVFVDLYTRLFLSKTSGAFMTAMGIVLLPQILAIESQMAAYVGGIVQQVVFTLIIFLPAIRFTPRRAISSAPLVPIPSRRLVS